MHDAIAKTPCYNLQDIHWKPRGPGGPGCQEGRCGPGVQSRKGDKQVLKGRDSLRGGFWEAGEWAERS